MLYAVGLRLLEVVATRVRVSVHVRCVVSCVFSQMHLHRCNVISGFRQPQWGAGELHVYAEGLCLFVWSAPDEYELLFCPLRPTQHASPQHRLAVEKADAVFAQ